MKRKTTSLFGFTLALLAAGSSAQDGSTLLQVRAKEIVLADGERIEDGVLIVADGVVRRVGRGVEIDERYPVIEHDGVLTAGLIACQTHSGAAAGETTDATRSFLPAARLVHAFDPDHPDFEKALRAGITSVVLAPTGDNVVGGITAVVKTAGGTVVKPEAHLALSLAGAALGRQARQPIFPFGSADTAAQEGGLENTERDGRGSRKPTSYAGALRELRQRFAESEGPFARARRGELLLLLEAWDRNEVARAAGFAREQGLAGAIYGAPLAGDPGLVELLAESRLGVVLGPYAPGQRRRSLEALGTLSEAGVPVAFALDAPAHSPTALRLSAAMAIGAGADRSAVWRALTSDAAKIAGVDGRVGTLERGKDADFVLWSGDPLNLTSRVEAVYVDGKRAWSHAGGDR